MPDLVQLLFPAPALVRTPGRLLRWWESRRLAYNVAVGAAGLVTVSYFTLLSHLPGPMHGAPIPMSLIVVYGVLANVTYSFGWLVESALQRWLRRDTYGLGPALFRHGLVFSVGLTLFPAALGTLAWIAGILFH
ncbi:MAG TPA: hypothetical protein VIJ16_04500 [Gemmatimonadaceae bacterium]